MIYQERRLFSWVDVDDLLFHVRKTKGLPEWVKSARSYLDALTITVAPGKVPETIRWLSDIFEPRFRQSDSPNSGIIILESMKDYPRQLQVVIAESQDTVSESRFMPTLSRPEILRPEILKAEPEDFPKDFPPLMALHSFKGGVGRTLLAIAIAKVLAEKRDNKVLLIDADLEAPGITWLLRDRLPNPSISFADILTLLHEASDSKDEIEKMLRLIADRLQSSYLDGIYVLPAFRSSEQFTSLQIKPEHLIRCADNRFILTHSLALLGKMLGVSTVIADLRAGLSELSTGFLLDPRVHRMFVTTLNPQSVEGTEYLLCLIRELTRQKADYPLPKIILSQIPLDGYLKERESIIKQYGERLGLKSENILLTAHEQRLVNLKDSWDGMMQQLRDSFLFSALSEWFVPKVSEYIPFTALSNSPEYNRKGAS